MCLQIFIAADKPLPVMPFDPAAPAFSVTELWPALANVRKQFSKPFVYDVSTHEGCACALQRTEYELDVLSNPDWPQENKAQMRAVAEERRKPAALLYACLTNAMRGAGSVELFTCWAGDENAEPVSRQVVTLPHFSDPLFGFEEKQFYLINPVERVAGLHQGMIWTSDDFDDPLPDEFWLGEEPSSLDTPSNG